MSYVCKVVYCINNNKLGLINIKILEIYLDFKLSFDML